MAKEINTRYCLVDETFRALVSVVTIDEIRAHSNADALELAIVGGWQVCVKKGEFIAGDRAIYCEIDTMLPMSHPQFAFLGERKDGLMMFKEGLYARIRTIKLRGELSQGLLLPIAEDEVIPAVGTNITQEVGAKKLEPIAQESVEGLDGKLAGRNTLFSKIMRFIAGPALPARHRAMPLSIKRSEQRRLQTIGRQYADAVETGEDFEVTYKLDGQSMTVFTERAVDGNVRFGVCGRDTEISMEDFRIGHARAIRRWIVMFVFSNLAILRTIRYAFMEGLMLGWIPALKAAWKAVNVSIPTYQTVLHATDEYNVAQAIHDGLLDKLADWHAKTGELLTIQGELVGPKIQGNREGLKERAFYVYAVYVDGQQLIPKLARGVTNMLQLKYTPVLDHAYLLPEDSNKLLKLADGKGMFDATRPREGLVLKSNHRPFSFKVISNKYLLKQEVEMQDGD